MSINGVSEARTAAPVQATEVARTTVTQLPVAALPVVADNGINVIAVAAAAAAKPAPPGDAEVQRAIAEVNKYLKQSANSVQFSIDEDSGKTVVKIVDPETDTVIRQIPSEQAVAISKDLAKLQGLLVRDKA